MTQDHDHPESQSLEQAVAEARERVSKWPRWILERSGVLEEFGLEETEEEFLRRTHGYPLGL